MWRSYFVYISSTSVVQPSPINSIKIAETDQKRVIHALIMKNIDK